MIGTRNVVNVAMRLSPPKITSAASTERTMPMIHVSTPNAFSTESAIVFACTET